MNIHENAKTTPKMRGLIVERRQAGERPCRIASAIGVLAATVNKWLARHAAEGLAGLVDRSRRPHRIQGPCDRWAEGRGGGLAACQAAVPEDRSKVGLSRSTVARIGKSCGLSYLSALAP